MVKLWAKRILGWSLVVVALAALSLIALRSKPEVVQSFRMANGNVVTFMGATYGTNHVMYWGKPYQRSLYKLLPAALKPWSGCRVQFLTAFKTNNPVFWMSETEQKPTPGGPGGASFPVRLLDEFGGEYEPQGYMSGSSWGLVTGGVGFYYQMDPAAPCGRIAGISLFDPTNRNIRLGKFLLPDAKLMTLPEAKQPPSPSQLDGDISFQLMSLVTGLKSAPGGFLMLKNGGLFTQATIRILKDGQPNVNWFPVSIKVSSADGKRVRTGTTKWGHKDGDALFNFEGVLDPADAPFKLKLEFMQQSGFTADQLLSFTNVPYPTPAQTIPLQLQREDQGQQFILESVNGSFAERPTNTLSMGQPFLVATMVPNNNSFHLRILRAADETGKPMWQTGWSITRAGEYYFGLQSSLTANSMDVTFVMHKSRFAEFEATPMFFFD